MTQTAPEGTETDAIAELALAAADLTVIDYDDEPTVLIGHADRLVALDLEHLADRPRRPHGAYTVATAAAMVTLIEQFDPDTERAHERATFFHSGGEAISSVVCVLNEHGDNGDPFAGHGDWTITWLPRLSDTAKRWFDVLGVCSQKSLADVIEDSLDVIAEPAAADLLDMVANFQTTTTIHYGSIINQRNGTHELRYAESEEGAGAEGTLVLPDRITLMLQVYRGGQTHQLDLGLRYKAQGGNLSIFLRMLDPDSFWDEANASLMTQVGDPGGALVLGGQRPAVTPSANARVREV